MPSISFSTSIAANSTDPNVLATSRFEYTPPGRVTRIRGGITTTATGLTATLSAGDRIIAENYVVPVAGTVGLVSRQNDFNFLGSAMPGERLSLSVTNSTVGPLVATSLIELI